MNCYHVRLLLPRKWIDLVVPAKSTDDAWRKADAHFQGTMCFGKQIPDYEIREVWSINEIMLVKLPPQPPKSRVSE